MSAAPRHLSYQFEGFDEAVIGFGDTGSARTILIIPPLFDEMNRIRAVLVGAMRELAKRGVATWLPDIPGCNESFAPIVQQSVESWREAMTAAATQLNATHIATVRGGALLATGIPLPQWRLAPVKGASLLKTMLRTRIASDKEAGRTSSVESLMADAQAGPVDLSGYRLNAIMLSEMETATADQTEHAIDVALGDGLGMVVGKPLWLRAEPQEDAEMSTALAAELDRWSASCGG